MNMKSVKGGLNATAAAVNLANILSSSFCNVRQAGFILLVNNAYNKDVHTKIDKSGQEDGSKSGEIRLSRDGELFVGGRKVDPDNPIPGYKVFMDTKKSASK
jgi:hypothetical protein